MSDLAKGTPAHVRLSEIDTLVGSVGDRFDWNVSARTVMHILVDYALICAARPICPLRLWVHFCDGVPSFERRNFV